MNNNFYILHYEAGAEHTPVPTWASSMDNPFNLHVSATDSILRTEIETVPACFQVLDVFTPKECLGIINTVNTLGFTQDASVSLPRNVRHNENLVWIADDATQKIIWQRVEAFIKKSPDIFQGQTPIGINQRFRFYKYGEGDFFKPHTDGAWPGSKVINKKLINDACDGAYSQMTFLLFLNDDFKGGATTFYVNRNDASRPAYTEEEMKEVSVRTPQGGVLCFPHGTHPQHCLHSSSKIDLGVKYIIRTDVLFK